VLAFETALEWARSGTRRVVGVVGVGAWWALGVGAWWVHIGLVVHLALFRFAFPRTNLVFARPATAKAKKNSV
jgi:hypothetical protein